MYRDGGSGRRWASLPVPTRADSYQRNDVPDDCVSHLRTMQEMDGGRARAAMSALLMVQSEDGDRLDDVELVTPGCCAERPVHGGSKSPRASTHGSPKVLSAAGLGEPSYHVQDCPAPCAVREWRRVRVIWRDPLVTDRWFLPTVLTRTERANVVGGSPNGPLDPDDSS